MTGVGVGMGVRVEGRGQSCPKIQKERAKLPEGRQ